LARHVADRVGRDFGGAETVEEPEGKQEGEKRNRPRVMRIDDSVRSRGRGDSFQPLRDGSARYVPGYGLEETLTLPSDAT
jgi:hypothetical protein